MAFARFVVPSVGIFFSGILPSSASLKLLWFEKYFVFYNDVLDSSLRHEERGLFENLFQVFFIHFSCIFQMSFYSPTLVAL